MSLPNNFVVDVEMQRSIVTTDCVSSGYLSPVVNYLKNCGLEVADILEGTIIGATYPDDIPDMLSKRDCEKIINTANTKLKQSPYMLGLCVGVSMRPTGFGQLGYVGMCSGTFDEALEHSSRFLPLVTPLMGLKYSQHDERVFLDIVELEPIDEPIYGFLIGLFLGGLRALSLFLLGDNLFSFISESTVRLKINAESYPDLKLLQQGPIDVQFGCEKNCISFSRELAFQPLLNGNESALKSAVVSCERLLEERHVKRLQQKDRIIEMVYSVIGKYDNAVPDLDEVAKILCLSPRTLSRRLESADTSFTKVAMDIRMLKAQRLFRDARLSIKEVSYRLGYSEVSNFSIAFKKYYGESPSEFRHKSVS